METKEQLRIRYKKRRKLISAEERNRLSLEIANQFMTFLENFPEVKHIHLFLPIAKHLEIDTFIIKEKLHLADKEVYTSIMLNTGRRMQTVHLVPMTSYKEDSWGIPVPITKELASPSIIHLVLIPLLVFGKNGHRIGYGKGYYDSFLSSLDEDVLKVGLSYFPPVKQVIEEGHDVPLNYCITPDKVYSFASSET